jgi:hypothetical protein
MGPLHPGFNHGVSAAQAYHAAQAARNQQAQAMMNRAFNPWSMGMMYSSGIHPAGGMGHMAVGGMHGGSHVGGMSHMSHMGGGHR